MSTPKRLSLLMSSDIDEIKIFLSNRQKLIEQKLIKCYAEEISSVISNLAVENCNGCITDHPSQRQHPCLMMESDERLFLYFDEALPRISEAKVTERFMESLSETKPAVNGLELLKYTCKDWRILFRTTRKQMIKQETSKLLQYDE